MELENSYQKEYRIYMEYALQQYLMEQRGLSEYDAKIKVMQDFEALQIEAKASGYL
ncbi:MAG: hypothetical protein HQM14_13765 [SAR324 cluster bacterium]|nr:hypothetical protein [SAR324 cluster bacterium]